MDIDTLYRTGEIIIAAILTQDTTEYYEKMHLQVELTERLSFHPTTQVFDPNMVATYHGPVAAAQRTRALYRWLQAGALCQPHASVELVRTARKPYYSPRNQQSSEKDAAAQKRDVRALSCITVTWGRYAFKFEDKCFVNDDGTIAAIDRTAVVPTGAAADDQAYLADKHSFLNEGKSRVNAPFVKPPVLDFSFKNLTDLIDAMRTVPTSGKKHKRAEIHVPKKDVPDEKTTFAAAQAAEEKRKSVIIRAKNRRGDEEAYEFQAPDPNQEQATNPTKPANGKGAAAEGPAVGIELIDVLKKDMTHKYAAESVRLSSNSLETLDHLVPMLRSLCVDSVLTITWLDLSCNRIVSVPPSIGTLLHLASLYLHSNNIQDWASVKTIRQQLHQLHSVTLFGNPIATKNPDYRQIALGILLKTNPQTDVPLKSLDFVALTGQDKNVTMMYEQFHPTPEKKRDSARAVKQRTLKLMNEFQLYA
jgi:hypothetical protein